MRYNTVSEAIRRTGSRQVLEPAVVLPSEGLAFTQYPRCSYIECEFTGINAEKKAILTSVRERYGLAITLTFIVPR